MAEDSSTWMERAFSKAGTKGHSLHASLGVPKDKKIPAYRVAKAANSKDKHVAAMARAAENANPSRRKNYGS